MERIIEVDGRHLTRVPATVGYQSTVMSHKSIRRHFDINRGKRDLILDEVTASVVAQLNDQAKHGVQVEDQNDVPETGPANRGLWLRIPNVTAVFADLKGSTALSSSVSPEVAAVAYTYFNRAMSVILEQFSAGYVRYRKTGFSACFLAKGPCSTQRPAPSP